MDIALSYLEKGSGQPLILLHGNGGSSKYFKKQIDYFSGDYRVIAIDTRGHGKSPRGEKPFTIEQFAQDLKDFMTEKKIGKAKLLGFSDGGNIALSFALKYQQMIDQMVVCGANIFPEGLKSSALLPRAAAYSIHKFFSINGKRTELLDLVINQPKIKPSDLKQIEIPVLVIAGTADMVREEHTKLIYESLPHSKLVFIEGGHLLPNMRPKQFNSAVTQFFTDEDRLKNF